MLRESSLPAFAVAGAIMAAAVGLRAALDLGLPALPPFITLYPAVAVAGLLCGWVAGGAACIAGLLAAIYLWIPPRHSFGLPDLTGCVAAAMFLAASGIMLAACAGLRAQLNAASLARSALDLGLAAGGVGIWEMNLASQRITASATARALHGLPEGQTRPEDWLRGVSAEHAAQARVALRAAVEGGDLASYTYRVNDVGGAPRWINARGKVVAVGGERVLLSALVDITEMVSAQDELRRERERLRLALQAGGLAVWDYDPATKETVIDTSYAATFGLGPEVKTLTRAEIGARMLAEDRPLVAATHEALLASGAPYSLEYRIVTPAGDIRWLRSQGSQVEGGTGPGRLVGIIQDITEAKRREQDLAELAELRALLIREADHRIKNSLQMVISLLTLQMRGIADPAAVAALRGAIARVGAIAASHLALQGSADLKQVDLAVTLRELCGHFAQLHPDLTVNCRAETALLLDADRAIPLGLTVSEVLTNALRHAFPGGTGTVTVDAWAEPRQLVVRVSDDGVGMQGATSGSGLGSSIIRSFAARLAASMDIASAPGEGTAVTLRLPLQDEETARRAVG